jgi:hypothetical protein
LGRAYSTYGREEADTGFCWGNLRERKDLKDTGVVRKIILMWFFRKWDVRERNG